jgi:nucleotide sugar dehydrogenase
VRVSVVALGKIGLPLAVQYASKGNEVAGIDVDARVVDLVNRGEEPFPGEAHLRQRLSAAVRSGALRATDDYGAAIPTAEVVVVIVPLVVAEKSDGPDFARMDSATRSIATHLQPGTLVIVETTLPVGTTRSRVKPMLEAGSGLSEGQHFHLVFSPERVLTGRVFEDLRRYPKLVGALSPLGAMAAISFYEAVLDFDPRRDLQRPNGVWDLGSAEAAEMAKLAETTYRDVNIALANQFARFSASAGVDVHQVIEASNSQPYSHIHDPGIAVGGHCIPVYPRLYLWNDPNATVVRAAREANEAMPEYAVGKLESAYGPLTDTTVVILGATYRGGVKETTFSGVFPIRDALVVRGAHVVVHDPMFDDEELALLGLDAYHLGEPVGAAIVQADHSEYRSLSPFDLPGARVVVDGRHVLETSLWEKVELLSL